MTRTLARRGLVSPTRSYSRSWRSRRSRATGDHLNRQFPDLVEKKGAAVRRRDFADGIHDMRAR